MYTAALAGATPGGYTEGGGNMRNKYADHEHYVSRANPTSGRTYNPERNGGALVTYGANEEPISYREVFVDGPPDIREFRPHRWMGRAS